MNKIKDCYHDSMLSKADEFGAPPDDCVCDDCGVKREDAWMNADDLDPFEKPSQQPHGGKCTMHCNRCMMYVEPHVFDGEEHCPYHQYVRHSEDGDYLQYDEFDQDGESI